MLIDEKFESQEVVLGGIPASFKMYKSAQEIQYTPETSLQEGINMVKTLKAHINHLELGSKMRKDVWMKEITRYFKCFQVDHRAGCLCNELVCKTRGRLEL